LLGCAAGAFFSAIYLLSRHHNLFIAGNISRALGTKQTPR
jgi:hypothetical protein